MLKVGRISAEAQWRLFEMRVTEEELRAIMTALSELTRGQATLVPFLAEPTYWLDAGRFRVYYEIHDEQILVTSVVEAG